MKNTGWVILLVSVLSESVLAQAVEPPVTELKRLTEALVSPDRLQAVAGARSLVATRSVVLEALRQHLASHTNDADRTRFDSPLHYTITALGYWRDRESAPNLANLLNLVIDRRTIPPGARVTDNALYPAAQALAQIGGKDARDAVLQRLSSDADAATIRGAAWVLAQDLGASDAALMVQKQIDGNLNKTHLANLQGVLDALKAQPVRLAPARLAPASEPVTAP
jgi:hypothetical protein